MRFPRYSLGLLLLALTMNCVANVLAHDYCVGSYGDYHCNGWASPLALVVLLWESFAFMLVVPIALVATVRIVQWLLMRGNAR